MKQGLCSRADLLRALVSDNKRATAYVAEALGYEWQPQEDKSTNEREGSASSGGQDGGKQGREEAPADETLQHFPDVPFWRLEACEFFEEQSQDELFVATPQKPEWHPTPEQAYPPLTSWSALLPRIRKQLHHSHASREIDLNKTVARLSRAEIIADLPMRTRRGWGSQVQLIMDRSNAMKPYQPDQISFIRELLRLFPKQAIQYAEYRQGDATPTMSGKRGTARQYAAPPPGTLVIAVTDLGLLTLEAEQKHWLRLGKQLIRGQCRPLALLPADAPPVDAVLGRYWQSVTWGKSRIAITADAQAMLERLLVLVSPATRIEPGFLRQVRQLIGADASVEAAFWQHPGLATRSSVAAALDTKVAKEKRAEFDAEEPHLRNQVLTLLRGWRTHLAKEIWYEEIISLSAESQALLPMPAELKDAYMFFAGLGRRLGAGENINGLSGWFRGLVQRVPDHVWQDAQLMPSFHMLWASTHQGEPDASPPHGYQPPATASSKSQPIECYQLYQHGAQLNIVRAPLSEIENAEAQSGSWLGELKSRSGELVIEPQARFWRSTTPPHWASRWGEDEYGPWVEFDIDTATETISQRMRWISPGSFMMGSPHDEPERADREGPQHQVILSEGYWLFDTAVPQALWQAAMGDNPSHFPGAEHPVENVSWRDCQTFIKKLNQLKPGLNLALPSEAQWEYACRAGEKAAFSFGNQLTTKHANYDGNYPYYKGEVGEYRQGTVEVKYFSPNNWGLYQMHGNVFEWCRDGLREYRDQAERDPLGPEKEGTRRVVRGGSWFHYACHVRAPYRDADHPEDRGGGVGFRCTRTQAGAQPVDPLRQRSGTHSSATDRKGVAQRVVLSQNQSYAVPNWPQPQDYVIRSDMGGVLLRQLIKPDWATAIGRDHFGLWVEFEIKSEAAVVNQRLRWIPPGRFMMGSPVSKHGALAQADYQREWLESDGPQHVVTLSQGYWLFDTPVTQALWQAVMGENPSEYQSPQRPVESVSWNDANAFIERINEQIPGLNLSLPTETQWEYACRATTETATYQGELEIAGERNAPLLDEIAWYGGNSGQGYELEQGFDSSAWREKQYGHDKAGTREVAQKLANGWGLYDMLGNVWEWCRDGMRDYQGQAEQDPVGLDEEGTPRVVRGGSWYDYARSLRAAYRDDYLPGGGRVNIGFRCARVQESAESRDGQGVAAGRRPDRGEME